MLNQYTFKIIVRPNHEMMDIQKMQISRKIVTGKVRYEESLQPPSLLPFNHFVGTLHVFQSSVLNKT